MALLHPDRLFPPEATTRKIARSLFEAVEGLPIISPHGHCDPSWFADNTKFPDPAQLFIVPDHYVLRMLVSQGISHSDLGVAPRDGGEYQSDSRTIWRLFAANYHLFLGTPSQMWIDHSLETLFDIQERLTPETADQAYDQIAERLQDDAYRPRALFKRFGIETLATTDSALDTLEAHQKLRGSEWFGHIIPTYRPDQTIDPAGPDFAQNVERLGALAGMSIACLSDYLEAHRIRRAFFKSLGATATDHGHPTAKTADLRADEAEALFQRCRAGASHADAELFHAQMLTEMARMSVDDGLVMQLHAGSVRGHSQMVVERYGPDKGFDIPQQTDFVNALRPLLNAVGHEPSFRLILFTLDETTYSRELAPLAGAYPSLLLGPAWWFFDSAEGMMRYRQLTSETAGIYNTAGFNDDTRAFCSIPARHDVARRVDCAWLATLVADHRISMSDAEEMAQLLTCGLARRAYRL